MLFRSCRGPKGFWGLPPLSREEHLVKIRDCLATRLNPNLVNRCIELVEDLDKLIESEKISLAHLLNMLDGLKDANGVLIIATSNEPQKLDPALLHRPSRFDRIWKFPLPGYEQRLALLGKLAGDRFSDQTLREAARKSEGFSMAYVQEIVVNAVLRCVDNGAIPDDSMLLSSLEMLRSQRKSASEVDEVLVERESLGFCQPT